MHYQTILNLCQITYLYIYFQILNFKILFLKTTVKIVKLFFKRTIVKCFLIKTNCDYHCVALMTQLFTHRYKYFKITIKVAMNFLLP